MHVQISEVHRLEELKHIDRAVIDQIIQSGLNSATVNFVVY